MAFTVRRGSIQHGILKEDPADKNKKVLENKTFVRGDELPADFPKDEIDRLVEAGVVIATDTPEAEAARRAGDVPPVDFPGHDALKTAGYRSLRELDKVSDEELLTVEGIGPKTLKEIRAALRKRKKK